MGYKMQPFSITREQCPIPASSFENRCPFIAVESCEEEKLCCIASWD
jgi:hypothetical protein